MTGGQGWNTGYGYIAILQIILMVILIFSLPIWKNRTEDKNESNVDRKPLKLGDIIQISGAKEIMITFFCYSALEQTTGLWASSYLTLHKGMPEETAAGFASMFFIGITIGRAFSGFITMKLNDSQMIRLGQGIIFIGIIILFLTSGENISLIGLIMIGLGCAPIYPCIIHSTPGNFGADKSQAIIGVQMASAYVGTLLMPPLFGLIAQNINISLYPIYIFALLILMVVMHEALLRKKSV